MQCQICQKNEATIHLTEIVEGLRSEMHICERCAQEQGIAVKSQIPLNELLSGLLASAPSDDEMLRKKGFVPSMRFYIRAVPQRGGLRLSL